MWTVYKYTLPLCIRTIKHRHVNNNDCMIILLIRTIFFCYLISSKHKCLVSLKHSLSKEIREHVHDPISETRTAVQMIMSAVREYSQQFSLTCPVRSWPLEYKAGILRTNLLVMKLAGDENFVEIPNKAEKLVSLDKLHD